MHLKSLIALFAASSMIYVAQAAQITGASLTFSTVSGEKVVELPSRGFKVIDITSEEGESALTLKNITVTTSGTIGSVTAVPSLYVRGTSDIEWFSTNIPRVGGNKWSCNVDADLLKNFTKGHDVVLEMYFTASDLDNGTKLYYNNAGENYKLVFTVGDREKDDEVRYLDDATAGISLKVDGDEISYTYNGELTRDNEAHPGEVQSLSLEGFWIACEPGEGVEIQEATIQYKVYEDGNVGVWNGIVATASHSISGTEAVRYEAHNAGRNLLDGLKPGTQYTLEIMYQLIDKSGKYHFFGRGNENMLFRFSLPEDDKEPGDVNGDNQVTVADVTAAYNVILGADVTYSTTADTNGDGQVTVADVTEIYNAILGVK